LADGDAHRLAIAHHDGLGRDPHSIEQLGGHVQAAATQAHFLRTQRLNNRRTGLKDLESHVQNTFQKGWPGPAGRAN